MTQKRTSKDVDPNPAHIQWARVVITDEEFIMSNELHFKPAYELAAMIRRRELKPSELMAATIARSPIRSI